MEVLTPRPMAEGQKTLFVTFYSFKGGVGRTLALLNTACILAGLGRRVLMIDFDLEAPGLTHFQDKQIEEGFSRQQLGLVDAIDDFLEDPWSSPIGDGESDDFFGTYVSSLDVPEGVKKGEKDGALDLVPAGRLDDEYETLLYDLDFEEMFEEGVGRPFFERLKDLIEESGRYDYILVDSRTGFSDEGSICTRFLSDYLLVLTGLNRQNVRGTARFLDRSNVAEREETLALVASPVPMYYEKLRAERIEAAKEHITERAGLEEVRFVTQIPYHPVLALEGDPTVRSLEGTDLFGSYEEIKERLQTWAGDLPEERIERVLDLAQNGERDNARAVFQDVRYENPKVALRFLRSSAPLFWRDYPELAVDLFGEGVAIAEELNDQRSKQHLLVPLASAYGVLGDIEQAIRYQKKALELSQKIGNPHTTAVSLFNLAEWNSALGNTDRTIELYEEARDLFKKTDRKSDEADALIGLGYQNLEFDKIEKAISLFRRALDQHSEVGNRPGMVLGLTNLGIAYAELGRDDEAAEALERAERIADEAEDNRVRTMFHLNAVHALALFKSRTALERLREYWPLILEYTGPLEKMTAHVLRARLRLEVEDDAEGAAEDAQKALDFYRERDVDSRWSREAKKILEKAQRRVE